jgi:selenocysteine lyase/cysteine desulfurase
MAPACAHSQGAIERYCEACVKGRGPGRMRIGGEIDDAKALYAKLINASPAEIAIVQSTLAGENIVVAGLGLHRGGGNVVTDELHYHGGIYIYKCLEKAGLEVRIVKQRGWKVHLSDLERAVDRRTRLLAITLVSNINGFFHDARAVSNLAHAHGAYLYADVVQAAGCVPVDVKAMGIDFCSASTYKWLMGLRGMGFLYVRRELQERVLQRTQFGDRQYSKFEYHNFPGSRPGPKDFTWEDNASASRYEVGNVSNIGAVCARESLGYLLRMGVENIQKHASPLVDRLRKEVPSFGYPCITPDGQNTPIAAFLVERPEPLQARLRKAGVTVKVKWNQMRISPSVFNTQADVDRLLNALG